MAIASDSALYLIFLDIRIMRSARIFAIVVMLIAFAFNEWAFRLIFPLQPIDPFLRSMTLVLDAFLLSIVITFLWKNVPFAARVKHLTGHSAKTVALFVGLFLAYCSVMTVEFGCRYYFKHIYKAPYAEETEWQPGPTVQDSILGSALPKDTVISHTYMVNDSLIYTRRYRTDKFGRRINPPTQPDSLYTDFMMVTGCSFAFGYGLAEDQTLSHYLDSLTGKRAYNYAVYGHGTQQILALLESRDLRQEIQQPTGTLVYLFIDDHIPRLIGSRRLIKLWAQDFPYYHLEGDELKRDGSFRTGRYFLTRFYRAISESAFIDLFDIDIPWYVSDGHLQLFSTVLRKAKQEFQTQYPNGRFLVVIGPNSVLAERVKDALQQNDIDVLDLSKLLDKEEKQYKIHWTEAHPNGKYYLEVAEEIEEYLKNASN